MSSLVMVSVGYEKNDNGFRVWERVEWIVYHSYHRYLSHANIMSLSNKESVIVSVAIPVHVSGHEFLYMSQGDIKTVSVQTKRIFSPRPCRSLNWPNGPSGEKIFDEGCRNGCI